MIARPLFFGRDLVDSDQLRKLAQILLALIFQRSRIGVGRGGLNLLVQLRNRSGQRIHLAGDPGRLLVQRRRCAFRLAAALEMSPASVVAEESTSWRSELLVGLASSDEKELKKLVMSLPMSPAVELD